MRQSSTDVIIVEYLPPTDSSEVFAKFLSARFFVLKQCVASIHAIYTVCVRLIEYIEYFGGVAWRACVFRVYL